MDKCFSKNVPALYFATPSTKIMVLGVLAIFFYGLVYLMKLGISRLENIIPLNFNTINLYFEYACSLLLVFGIALLVFSVVIGLLTTDAMKIAIQVRKKLCCYRYGNPLNLKEGEILPKIKCRRKEFGVYELTVLATTNTVEEIQEISSSISSSLNRKYKRYAVTVTNTDVAFNEVAFKIEDVAVDKTLYITSVEQLRQTEVTKLIVQKGTYIDLETSGSMLIAGKTRSGKTTSIICLLLQVLLSGRDCYESEVMIIDPKQAELSRLPHVYTLDETGEARQILEAMKCFADTIVKRQQILNDMSEKKGDVVHWWEAGFKVSLLFIDEYVSARTMFPKRASKEEADYSLATFDGLIKRIVTMGASTGSYVIISIAEASVEEGGLPAMLRSAMTTKILFKPTITEARLMWGSDKVKDFSAGRVYGAGDAWFSSTDGIHDDVSYVHFPVMDFPVYRELGKLLEQYYESS